MNTQLVIGASGQVGEHLLATAHASGKDVVGTHLRCPTDKTIELNICEPSAIHALFESIKPSVVYLPAAMANVDYCEQFPVESAATNVRAVENIVDEVNRIQAKLVFFSTDYVFDGASGPYSESDRPNPKCQYGVQKLFAEELIRDRANNFLIIRTTVVYGWERQRKNFVCRLLERLGAGESVKVPCDQIGTPTYAPDLARVVIQLVELDANGLFHVVGPDRMSRYEFACEIAEVFGLNRELIHPVPTCALNQVASRPLGGGLLAKAMTQFASPLFGCRAGLLKMAADEVKDEKQVHTGPTM